jgi:hypothetical protein
MPKLRTYKIVKINRDTEYYIRNITNRIQRSAVAKMRIGNFPINLEQERHRRQPIEERVCPCCEDRIEDERHFLLDCPIYNETRNLLFTVFQNKTGENLKDYCKDEQLYLLLNINLTIKNVATYIVDAYKMRTQYELNKRKQKKRGRNNAGGIGDHT